MVDSLLVQCPAVTGELFAGLLSGDLTHAARAAYFVHLQGCGACQQRLLAEAPELLLAASEENLAMPEPLDLPRLIARLPERSRIHYWQIAAMLLMLFGSGALLLRKSANSGGKSGVALAHHSSSAVHPAILTPAETLAAARADQPAIESGADEFQIREYEAPGFDGKTVQWVHLTPTDSPAAAVGARS
jgi:hypothetical protein